MGEVFVSSNSLTTTLSSIPRATRRSNLGLEIGLLKEACPIQSEHVDLFGHFYFGDQPNKNEIENILLAIENMDIMLDSASMTITLSFNL